MSLRDVAPIDHPRREDFAAMGMVIYEFGQIERTIDEATASAVAIVQAIDPACRVPYLLTRRVQMLLTFHRTRSPMRDFRSDVEPLLKEIRCLLLVRNDIAHGRLQERDNLEELAARLALLNNELIGAMKWRAPQAVITKGQR